MASAHTFSQAPHLICLSISSKLVPELTHAVCGMRQHSARPAVSFCEIGIAEVVRYVCKTYRIFKKYLPWIFEMPYRMIASSTACQRIIADESSGCSDYFVIPPFTLRAFSQSSLDASRVAHPLLQPFNGEILSLGWNGKSPASSRYLKLPSSIAYDSAGPPLNPCAGS